MKVIALLAVTGILTVCITFVQHEEIYRTPDDKVSVHFVKRPLADPKIELRAMNGVILAKRIVSEYVEADDIEIHLTDQGIVVLPGDSDWLWKKELWE